ncbi:MAG TPA: PAS domain S-box protein [Gemmatimonadaceae bacterium]|nr:PAS domain S-box protein [Gemmatimonadaceae bacterium]
MKSTNSNNDFRSIVESAPDAIIVYTAEKFLYLNEFAARRLGAEAGELVGQPIMAFVHPDSIPVVSQRIHDLFGSGGVGAPLEVKFRSRTGEAILAEIVTMPITFEGQPARLGLIRDIARRADAERALRESEELFASAFRMSPLGMCFVNPQGQFTKVNRAMCEMLGYTEEELLHRRFADITHPDDITIDLDQLRRLTAREISSYYRTKRYVRGDGRQIWVSIAVAAVHDSDGKPIYFIGQIQDITLQRQLEDERANKERRAGITETTIAVAHEMNNVLTILTMNAELLVNGATADEIPELAGEVLQASKRIASTVQRLRNVIDTPSVSYLGEKKMLDLSSRANKSTGKRLKRSK